MTLTPALVAVLDLLVRTTDAGQQAGYREVMAELGFTSTHAVACALRRLEALGYVRRDSRRARSVTILRNIDGAPYLTLAERYDALRGALGCAGKPFLDVLAVARARRAA